MRTKTTSEPLEIPEDFAPLVAAFARDPEVIVERGWGAGNIVLKVGGKIFVMSIRGDLVAKLPKKRVDALVDDDAGVRFDPRRDGRVMSEWIVVAADAVDWVALAREALAYVRAGGAPVKAPRPPRSSRPSGGAQAKTKTTPTPTPVQAALPPPHHHPQAPGVPAGKPAAPKPAAAKPAATRSPPSKKPSKAELPAKKAAAKPVAARPGRKG